MWRDLQKLLHYAGVSIFHNNYYPFMDDNNEVSIWMIITRVAVTHGRFEHEKLIYKNYF